MKFILAMFLFSQSAVADLVLPLCYLNRFQVEKFPWKMDDCLNYEEVFKNSQFDEAKWEEKKNILTVRHFSNGQYQTPQIYIFKDGQLTIHP